MENKLAFDKGSILGDAQDFYHYFTYLIRLTIQLKELEVPEGDGVTLDAIQTNLKDVKIRLDMWRRKRLRVDSQSLDVEAYLDEGLRVFDEYYKLLMHFGVIALPTKKG